MLLFIAAASIAAPATPSPVTTDARAFIRIEHAVVVNEVEWKRGDPEMKRRERIVLDERGAPQLQRVVDFE